jgi:hypothetical protein
VKLFLLWGDTKLYYAGPKNWVPDREQALNLETIKRATDVGYQENLDSMKIVISYGDPSSDWFMPLPRRQMLTLQPAPASAEPPLPKAA